MSQPSARTPPLVAVAFAAAVGGPVATALARRRLRRPRRRERHHPADQDVDAGRLPRRRRALRHLLRVHRRRRVGRLDRPAARHPDRGGARRRLDPAAPGPGGRAAAERARVRTPTATALAAAQRRGDPRDADRRPRHHRARGRRRRGRHVGTRQRLPAHPRRARGARLLRPAAARSSWPPASTPPAPPSSARPAGDGTPIMLTIPTDAPWVPLRILQPRPRGRASSSRPTCSSSPTRSPTCWPAARASASSAASRPTTCLLDDLRSDVGMEWVPDDMWFTYLAGRGRGRRPRLRPGRLPGRRARCRPSPTPACRRPRRARCTRPGAGAPVWPMAVGARSWPCSSLAVLPRARRPRSRAVAGMRPPRRGSASPSPLARSWRHRYAVDASGSASASVLGPGRRHGRGRHRPEPLRHRHRSGSARARSCEFVVHNDDPIDHELVVGDARGAPPPRRRHASAATRRCPAR